MSIQQFIGVYWTRPVPWAGFTALSRDVETAAMQSRTIRYQREAVMRYVKDVSGVLECEVALLELAPDRATPESASELRKIVVKASARATFISIAFTETRGWRPHPFIREGLPVDRTLALPPDPIMLDGKIFDPIQHFQNWREHEKLHSGTKELHRATILAALQEVNGRSFPTQAGALNAAGLRTFSGKVWTADNLRKFWIVSRCSYDLK
ncbi:hypothetical protein [Pseudotabrizicola sediminis]|uniref:hypothetical protein n=1 Tax=Pseudotabrizicola sediminis TaxID=2486418 RepID=UPI00108224E9|nr:hypothetical protein [Pseudotabrizicola sediminis]